MADEISKKRLGRVYDMVVDRLDTALDAVGESLGPTGRMPSREVVEKFNVMVAMSPPVEMILPDGTPFTESPAVLLMKSGEVGGGAEFLRRYRRAMKKLPLEEIE